MSPIADTSILARIDNAPRAKGQRDRILRALECAGKAGLTREEAAQETETRIQSVCPAVRSLIAAGYVDELERTRPTKSGSQAKVLVVSRKRRRAILADALASEVGTVRNELRAMAKLGWIERTRTGHRITAKGWAVIAK